MTFEAESPAGHYDLELNEITKRFGSVTALNRASLKLRPNSIHALLGENGAGKTTLMRVAFGMIKPDSGVIRIKGNEVKLLRPSDAIAAGIGMVHQQFSLVPEMTVVENVSLGGRGRFDKSQVAADVAKIAERLGMKINPFAKVKDLTASERQKLEIIRTFAHNATTLILDEPTALLTPRDVGDLFAQLRVFSESGGSVVLITHRLRDAIAHADDVTVLRKGQCVLNAAMSDLDESQLADAMLGRASAPKAEARRSQTHGRPVLQLKNVSFVNSRGVTEIRDVSLEINAGEIVGIAALEGAARFLLRVMAARANQTSGQVKRPASIGFVPEDRAEDAVIPDFSLTENMALHDLGAKSGRMNWSAVENATDMVIRGFDVRTSGASSAMSELSGGNQQKFVLGRELNGNPELLILENPTQGLDVHAAATIHDRVLSARDEGMAIVLYSSDIDELAAVADRVLVVSDDGVVETPPERDAIGNALLSRHV